MADAVGVFLVILKALSAFPVRIVAEKAPALRACQDVCYVVLFEDIDFLLRKGDGFKTL